MHTPRALLVSEVFGVKLKFYRSGPVHSKVTSPSTFDTILVLLFDPAMKAGDPVAMHATVDAYGDELEYIFSCWLCHNKVIGAILLDLEKAFRVRLPGASGRQCLAMSVDEV